MKVKCISFFSFLIVTAVYSSVVGQERDFKNQQQKYARVRQAYSEKYDSLDHLLRTKGITHFNYELLIMTFKQEQLVEVWVKPKVKKEFLLLTSYDFCHTSGKLGPKRKQGDLQIPEGFYRVDRFNPNSNFYLSLGLNYPNSSDKIRSDKKSPGGDIFIHGDCVTIGCIPITNDKIKELYVLAVEAKENGQSKIRVFMFPFKMTVDRMNSYKSSSHYAFWKELEPAYTYFMANKLLPVIRFNNQGEYLINP
ncbi:MAG: L,D-transpeptidase family protein [Bacteroidetes bacterium]|nr:L,D-transpeptidase family protein [Bacteroidota bacterium]